MNISYSCHLSKGNHDISNKSQLRKCSNHNSRGYKTSNNPDIDFSLTHQNICIYGDKNIYRSVERIYEREFKQAVEDYNSCQSREDRKIYNYFDKVAEDKKQSLANEIIIQIGDKNFWKDKKLADKKKIIEVMKNQVEYLQELYPNFKVANATLHLDETSPHLHIVGVAVADKNYNSKKNQFEDFKTGLKKRVNKNAVFNKRTIELMQNELRAKAVEDFSKVFNLEIENFKEKGRNYNYSVEHYKEIQKLENEKDKISQEVENLKKEKTQIVTEIEKKKRELNQVKNQLEEDKKELTNKETELKEKNENLKILRKDIVENQKFYNEVMLVKAEYNKINYDKDIAEKELKNLKKEKLNLENYLNDFTNRMIEKLSNQYDFFISAITDLIEKAENSINCLDLNIKKEVLEQCSKSIGELKAEIKAGCRTLKEDYLYEKIILGQQKTSKSLMQRIERQKVFRISQRDIDDFKEKFREQLDQIAEKQQKEQSDRWKEKINRDLSNQGLSR